MSTLRIGDAEREATIALLKQYVPTGHLSQQEFERRMEAALRATYDTDFNSLIADLPGLTPTPKAWWGTRIGPAGWWGAWSAMVVLLVTLVPSWAATVLVPTCILLATLRPWRIRLTENTNQREDTQWR